ncbi:MAG TPA: hypothetical protein VM534_06825 [Thermoanaerobaculia bacterium]|nr:hypothetical protein [Thermoanaerobaculia bacterium]
MSKLLRILAVMLLVVGLIGCEVEQTEEGEMPNIEVEGGKLPEYDVDVPDVDIGTQTTTVEVPTGVEIETTETTVTIPDVDVNPPEDDTAGN